MVIGPQLCRLERWPDDRVVDRAARDVWPDAHIDSDLLHRSSEVSRMSYHPKELAPGTPPEWWIETTNNVNSATARGDASGISLLIKTYGLERMLIEDVCDIRNLYRRGVSSARTRNRRYQRILRQYHATLRETSVVQGVEA